MVEDRTPSSLRRRVEEFANQRGLVIHRKLGEGTDGAVWKVDRLAVKCFLLRTTFASEVEAYHRLLDRGISEITIDSRWTFSVPRLVEFDSARLLMAMTIVQPPFLLDFGKSYVDRIPDYSQEVLEDCEADAAERFGRRWPIVKKLLSRLRAYGIYYADAKPGNIEFRDDD